MINNVSNGSEKLNSIVALNFLELSKSDFNFTIYVRECIIGNEKKESESIGKYKLPDIDNEGYKSYWVSLQQYGNFVERSINSMDNCYLTNYFLSKLLKDSANTKGVKFKLASEFNRNRIHFVLENLKEGEKTVFLEPYFLKIKKTFGFLIDYTFLKNPNYKFDRRVLQLSLSLDDYYRSNKNFHIDKFYLIKDFLDKNESLLKLRGDLIVSNKFTELEGNELDKKTYVFFDNKVSYSQFNGVMQFGPFKEAPISNLVHYYYLFESTSKRLANDLINALSGGTFATFLGLEKLKLPKHTENNTTGISLGSYNVNEIGKVIDNIKNKSNEKSPVIISIFPRSEELFYYTLKSACLKNDFAFQCVNTETVQDENKLKWSVSGIALQIFTKLGGVPWLVKGKAPDYLIVGVGQAHRRVNGEIKDYFAYSILIESSGKFLRIQPLAKSSNKTEYLKQLSDKVAEIIQENEKKYSRIVFHIPEKIKREDVLRIEDALKNVNTNVELYMIKINDNTKYFGYNPYENSLVPYENTFVKLSEKEYLIWTEGLDHDNKLVNKRYSNPINVEFYYSNVYGYDPVPFLQDILNLSGANYRGFNSKAIPVSVYYPKLVAGIVKNFDEFNIDYEIGTKESLWFI